VRAADPDHRVANAVAVVAAPAIIVLGWIVLILGAGQRANDGWAVGHLLLFCGNALWLPAAVTLRREARAEGDARLWTVALGLVLVGTLAVAGQLAIDLAAWALTDDVIPLSTLFEAMRSRLPTLLLFYLAGPPALFLGIAVTGVALARARADLRTGGYIVAGGLVVVLVGAVGSFSYVILAGFVTVLAGSALIAVRIATPSRVAAEDLASAA
jgi:hypothetical protein